MNQVRHLEGDSSLGAKPTVRLSKLENEMKADLVAKRLDVGTHPVGCPKHILIYFAR